MSLDEAREPIMVIADILSEELELPEGQIMLTNQKWDVPKNAGLYIVLNYIESKVIGMKSQGEDVPSGMQEVQESVVRHLIQIDLMSFSSEARTRGMEVLMALQSIRSQKAQEENNLQIARNPGPMMDVSSLEETARLNRYTVSIAVTALHRKTKALPEFYEDFQNPEVTVNA